MKEYAAAIPERYIHESFKNTHELRDYVSKVLAMMKPPSTTRTKLCISVNPSKDALGSVPQTSQDTESLLNTVRCEGSDR